MIFIIHKSIVHLENRLIYNQPNEFEKKKLPFESNPPYCRKQLLYSTEISGYPFSKQSFITQISMLHVLQDSHLYSALASSYTTSLSEIVYKNSISGLNKDY